MIFLFHSELRSLLVGAVRVQSIHVICSLCVKLFCWLAAAQQSDAIPHSKVASRPLYAGHSRLGTAGSFREYIKYTLYCHCNRGTLRSRGYCSTKYLIRIPNYFDILVLRGKLKMQNEGKENDAGKELLFGHQSRPHCSNILIQSITWGELGRRLREVSELDLQKSNPGECCQREDLGAGVIELDGGGGKCQSTLYWNVKEFF